MKSITKPHRAVGNIRIMRKNHYRIMNAAQFIILILVL